MNIVINTYSVLKCTSGKKPLLHLAHGPPLEVIKGEYVRLVVTEFCYFYDICRLNEIF